MRHESPSLTREQIENGLHNLGLSTGDAVEVHSSLRSMGYVIGGADTVIDALMNVVGKKGAIIMSAYPTSKPLALSDEEKKQGIHAKVEIYDESYDGPTGMGIIVDKFKKRQGIIIGKGIHRVCAWGNNADLHSQGFNYLMEIGGLVLLIGVGIHRCSSMHQAEKNGLPEEVKKYFAVPEHIRKEYPSNYFIDYGGTPENGWDKVMLLAEQRGLIKKVKIGSAVCMLFGVRDVVGIYGTLLQIDPLGLFGIKSK
jgi:aminoglycoside N3'-acetyltransferase